MCRVGCGLKYYYCQTDFVPATAPMRAAFRFATRVQEEVGGYMGVGDMGVVLIYLLELGELVVSIT